MFDKKKRDVTLQVGMEDRKHPELKETIKGN